MIILSSASGAANTVTVQPRAPAQNRLPGLDTLRALAITVVMVFHLDGLLPDIFGPVARFGWMGVDLFFVLSGFLLFRPWVQTAQTGADPPSLRRYAWHRVRRIMPAYVVTVLIAYLLYHFRTAGPNPGLTCGFGD